jgi:hypothetical protein
MIRGAGAVADQLHVSPIRTASVKGQNACDHHETRFAGEQEEQCKGNTQYPLTHRHRGQHLIDQQSCTLHHAPGAATGTEPTDRDAFVTAKGPPARRQMGRRQPSSPVTGAKCSTTGAEAKNGPT